MSACLLDSRIAWPPRARVAGLLKIVKKRCLLLVAFGVRMFERLDPWSLLLGWVGCAPRNFSDLVLLSLASWLTGFICGALVVIFCTSRVARSILWNCLGVIAHELREAQPQDRLARYRGGVHEHRA